MDNPYFIAATLAENGKYEMSWKILGTLLNTNPNDSAALIGASHVMLHMGALPQSYHFAKAATRLELYDDGAWLNLGHAAAQLCLWDEAEVAYRTALQNAKSERNRNSIWICMSALYIDTGNFKRAEEFCQKILHISPDNKKALANLGFCQLAKHDWADGWKNYHHTVGSNWRKKVNYKDEPEWDGTPGKTVVVYADQGIGDEISFASMIPDAARFCRKLILDCDGRLERLFRRSFPDVTVYGTKMGAGRWAKEDHDIDASLSIGQLGEFVRTLDSEFTGRPYLVPCPVRLKQWRELFDGLRKPVVGIAWTGGVAHTNARNRRVSLNDLLPVLSLDAHFVSLQYKDAAEEITRFKAENPGVDLEQYRWATLTDDYDDTAALVAACDYVLCIQTAVARTAGALGVPCSVLLPTASNWFYSNEGETVPWHASIRIIRQQRDGDWTREIELAAERIATELRIPRGTAAAA